MRKAEYIKYVKIFSSITEVQLYHSDIIDLLFPYALVIPKETKENSAESRAS